MRGTALALLLAPALAGADTLVLRDGRVFERPVRKVEAGYSVEYEHGAIVVPEEMVAYVYRDDETLDIAPRTDEEKEKFAKGLVPWNGRWVTKAFAKTAWEKEREARRVRAEQMKERREWRNHAEVKSRRWVFRHTLPDDLFAGFQTLFERYFDFYTGYWNIRPPSGFGKPTIHIYHDEDYFHQVSGAPQGVAGYYVPATRELHFYYDREHHEFAVDVMFHETSHLLTHMIDERTRYPAWLNEGMAEVFGATRYDPESGAMEIGHLQSGRLAVLQASIEEGKWMPLETLLRQGGIDALGYAWAWSLCHFLITHETYGERFRKYFLAIGRSTSIRKQVMGPWRFVEPDDAIEALKSHLKVRDLKELEKEWHQAVKAMLERADLDWHQAGHIMMLWGQEAKARDFLKRAIDKGSKNAFDYYNYGRLQLNRGKTGVAAERAEEALRHDPLHARARSLLGFAKFLLGERDEGKRLLAWAEEMDPSDPRIWADKTLIEEAEEKEKEGQGG